MITKPIRNWLYFGGMHDYILIPTTLKQINTIIAFFKPSGKTDTFPAIISKAIWTGTNIKGYILRNIGSNLVLQVGDGTNNKTITISAWDTAPKMASATLNEENAQLSVYLNGEKITTTDLIYSDAGDYATSLARSQFLNATQSYFQGDIYFAALYNRALGDTEINHIYNYVVNRKGNMITDGLVLWLDGDSIDPENEIWHDKSGRNNSGIIYGATFHSNISQNINTGEINI